MDAATRIDQECLGRILRHSPELVTREIAGETLVVPITGQVADMHCVYALNEVARFIWERLDGRRDLDTIAAEVVEVFDVTVERARRDLLHTVVTLEQARLVLDVDDVPDGDG